MKNWQKKNGKPWGQVSEAVGSTVRGAQKTQKISRLFWRMRWVRRSDETQLWEGSLKSQNERALNIILRILNLFETDWKIVKDYEYYNQKPVVCLRIVILKPESPRGLIKTEALLSEFVIQYVFSGALDTAFVTTSQVMLMQLAGSCHSENHCSRRCIWWVCRCVGAELQVKDSRGM